MALDAPSPVPPLFEMVDLDRALARGEPPLPLFRFVLGVVADELRERFRAGAPATVLVPARAHFMDQLLLRVWRQFFAPDARIALLAVGGYGRGELHPGSDIDLQILLPDADAGAALKGPIEQFLMFLWDIGLEVGHSVRTVQECTEEAARDITVATNLQEGRLLAGPQELFAQQRQRCSPPRIWPSREFFAAKWQEQIARHRKFDDTAYNLEPNVKEGPGGLRDIQMIAWVAARHFGARGLHDLVGHGFLTEQEYASLMDGQAFLWQVRFGLHILAGRREDRLLFDHQRTLAKQFGYVDDNHRLAVEHFMKRYYRTVMQLSRLNEMLLQLFQEEILLTEDPGKPVPLNRRFQARKGFIEAASPAVFKRYPFALLEIFLLLQQHPELKGVRANTIRLLRDHRYLIDDGFRNDLRCRSLFMAILREPQGITHALRRMNSYGVLGAYLPTFGNIVGQMQHDLFHVYTVDAHTLFVIRNLRRFTVAEFRHEFPLCSDIIQRIPKPELLYLAALFHDIAKGRGGDHSELGAADAETFCVHHGLSAYDARLVGWLVRNHLLMSLTAQRKDIGDPGIIHAFAQDVGDQTRLDYLYLLTVADIRATSPVVWNSWKAALLLELYQSTVRALRRGLESPQVQSERIRETQHLVRKRLLAAGLAGPRLDAFWRNLGDDYFLRYSEEEILWHHEAILREAPEQLPLVLVRQETRRGGTEIFIYAREHDSLFAQVASLLDQLGLTVTDARIVSSRDGYTLHTFIVLEEDGKPIGEAFRIQELTTALARRLAEPDAPPGEVTRRLPRQAKYFKLPTEVSFSEDPRNQRTVMEVITHDRPGLLARIGSALIACGVRLQNAKIATFGARAEDIFFITDKQNEPLRAPAQFECLRSTLVRLLDEDEAAAEGSAEVAATRPG